MKTTVSSKGQIVLPAELRNQDEILPGQVLEIERIEPGKYELTRVHPPRNEGLLRWLQSCPEKDFFVAIDSESTDTL